MLTKRDIQIIEEIVDRKLDQKIDSTLVVFEEKMDEKFEKFYTKIHDDIASYKDKIFGVINPLQEDHDVLAHQTGGVRDDVVAIHTRVQNVEKILKLPVDVLPSLSA